MKAWALCDGHMRIKISPAEMSAPGFDVKSCNQWRRPTTSIFVSLFSTFFSILIFSFLVIIAIRSFYLHYHQLRSHSADSIPRIGLKLDLAPGASTIFLLSASLCFILAKASISFHIFNCQSSLLHVATSENSS